MDNLQKSDLPPRQQDAVIALLTEPSIAKAAFKVNISEKTLRRWMNDPKFAAEYRKARREVFGQAIALVQRYAAMAVNTFAKVMADASVAPQAKVAAAAAVLRFGRQGIELDDLAARVEALEQTAMNQKDSRCNSKRV